MYRGAGRLLAAAGLVALTTLPDCRPLTYVLKEAEIVKPDSNPRKGSEGRGMTPRELQRQILGAPIEDIKYDYPRIRRDRER